MEVIGQLHALAALNPGKKSLGIRKTGDWVAPLAGLDALPLPVPLSSNSYPARYSCCP
jgi:hypothetical protein